MYDFYNAKSKRVLKIAEMIITSNESVTLDEISAANECSIRTVYADIDYLKALAKDMIVIEERQSGLYSHTSSIAILMDLKAKVLKEELFTNLLLMLYFNEDEHIDIYDLSLELDYSESYIRQTINAINLYLKDFSSEIINNKGYYLNINNHIAMATLIYSIMKNTYQEDEIVISESTLVTLTAFMNNNHVAMPKLLLKDLSYIYQLLLYKKADTHLFFQLISNTRHYYNSLNLHQQLTSSLKKYRFYLNDLEIYKTIDIFQSFSIKLALVPYCINRYMNRFHYFYEAFCKENKAIAQYLHEDLEALSNDIGINYCEFEEEIVYYLYTELHFLRKYKTYNIAVYSDSGTKHAESMIQSIKKHFPQHYFFQYQRDKCYDLLITNAQIRVESDIQTVIVADFISSKDIIKIYDAIYLQD